MNTFYLTYAYNVDTMGRELFAGKTIPEISLASCIKCFPESWKIVMRDQSIWTIEHRYKV